MISFDLYNSISSLKNYDYTFFVFNTKYSLLNMCLESPWYSDLNIPDLLINEFVSQSSNSGCSND